MQPRFYVETQSRAVTSRQLVIRAASHILNPPTCLKTFTGPKSEHREVDIETSCPQTLEYLPINAKNHQALQL